MLTGVTLEFFIGDSYERNFTIKQYSDAIDEIYFTIKNNDADKNYVLQKRLDDGITIVEDTTIDGIRVRTYNLFVDATDTENLKTDTEYPFDIQIVTEKEETNLKRTIIKGVVTLNEATTRVWNEVDV